MKLGFGPLDVSAMSATDIKSTVALLESKGYDFVILAGSDDSLIATAIAAPASRDLRLFVAFDRTIDPLRDAEDLAVLDQLSGGRIAILLEPAAVSEIVLAEEMLRGLAGKIVRDVRVFPRPAQLSIPLVAPAERAVQLGATPMSSDVQEDHFVTLSIEDLIAQRDDIVAHSPFAISVTTGGSSGLEGLVTAQHLREALYVDDKAQRITRKMPTEALAASDLDSPIHRI